MTRPPTGYWLVRDEGTWFSPDGIFWRRWPKTKLYRRALASLRAAVAKALGTSASGTSQLAAQATPQGNSGRDQ